MLTILVLFPLSKHCIHVECVALCQSTYVPSTGEAPRHQAKEPVTDSKLLARVLIVIVFAVYAAACSLLRYPAAAHAQSGVKQLVLSVCLSVCLSSKIY